MVELAFYWLEFGFNSIRSIAAIFPRNTVIPEREKTPA